MRARISVPGSSGRPPRRPGTGETRLDRARRGPVPHRSGRRVGILVLSVALLAMAPAGVRGQAAAPTEPQRVLVAGNDEVVWLIVGQWDAQEKAFLNRFATQDKTGARLRQAGHLLPQKGLVVRAAVVGEDLHVFFGRDEQFGAEGAHYRYSRSASGRTYGGVRRELMLPGPVMPVAVAGEPGGVNALLWAVVDGETAAAVHEQWLQSQRPDEPDDEVPDEDTDAQVEAETQSVDESAAALSVDADAYHLVVYERSSWRLGPAVPEASRGAGRFWLCCGEDQFHLFWQADAEDRVVHYARHADEEWTVGPPLALASTLAEGAALLANRQVVFAALTPHPAGGEALLCTPWLRQSGEEPGGGWRAVTPLHAAGGSPDEPLALPAGSAVGGFLDKLVVLQAGPDGAQVSFHSATAGGPPDEPWRPVPLPDHSPASRTQRGLRDFAATMVVALVLLLVFWRRQESIASPVLLPVGLGIAGLGKRVLAAVIDLLPAVAVTSFIWGTAAFEAAGSLATMLGQWWTAATSGQTDPPEGVLWPEGLPWAWLACRVLYVAYCVAFELTGRATPGKRLLRCEVRHETLEQPNAVQILIRNIARLVELEPYLQVWPFMLVVFFTRNRQRVGDLLARTVVIERQRVPRNASDVQPPPPPKDPA